MSSLSSSEEQIEVIVDLLNNKKTYKEIQSILSLTKSKMDTRLGKIAILMYENGSTVEQIVEATYLSEARVTKLINDRDNINQYKKNKTIKVLLSEIQQKQEEIQEIQGRILAVLNEQWKD